jgi:molybdopterin-guanine dinucleotide biosynthesis protein
MVQITGERGTGKTILLLSFVRALREQSEPVPELEADLATLRHRLV